LTRSCSTLCLPVRKGAYRDAVADPWRFRAWLDQAFRDHPELFPTALADGYLLKDERRSAQTGLRLRLIRLKSTGQSFFVRPSFALPYLSDLADDVQAPVFLRSFGVSFWVSARLGWCGEVPPSTCPLPQQRAMPTSHGRTTTDLLTRKHFVPPSVTQWPLPVLFAILPPVLRIRFPPRRHRGPPSAAVPPQHHTSATVPRRSTSPPAGRRTSPARRTKAARLPQAP
jgi:hypothetical protein